MHVCSLLIGLQHVLVNHTRASCISNFVYVWCCFAGVIHGDLKAANVMLTQGGDDQEGVWAPTFGHRVGPGLQCSNFSGRLCMGFVVCCLNAEGRMM
jgi:hypothetical protein